MFKRRRDKLRALWVLVIVSTGWLLFAPLPVPSLQARHNNDITGITEDIALAPSARLENSALHQRLVESMLEVPTYRKYKYMQVIGPVNSGTNWMEALIRDNCPGEVHHELYPNKHSFLHFAYSKERPAHMLLVVMAKDPLQWVKSVRTHPYSFLPASDSGGVEVMGTEGVWKYLHKHLLKLQVQLGVHPMNRLSEAQLIHDEVVNWAFSVTVGKLNKLPVGTLLHFWSLYYTSIVHAFRGEGIVFVPYEAVLRSPTTMVDRICACLLSNGSLSSNGTIDVSTRSRNGGSVVVQDKVKVGWWGNSGRTGAESREYYLDENTRYAGYSAKDMQYLTEVVPTVLLRSFGYVSNPNAPGAN